jgi:ADP-ribose pyrophosphatase YjhB (NUDIX family)
MSEAPLTARLYASVIIKRDDRFLVLNEEDDDGKRKFNLPGGHVDFGETPVSAATREAKEETGLEVAIGPLVSIRVNTWARVQSIGFAFSATAPEGDVKTESGASFSWMTEEEIRAIDEVEWMRGVKDFLLLAASGYTIDPRALLLFEQGERVKTV